MTKTHLRPDLAIVVARVRELIAVGMTWEARSEFRAALDDPTVALSLAELAAESEWHSLAIEAAAAAQAWGRVDLRFPVVYESEFMNASPSQAWMLRSYLL